jgi:hypothetical protein
MRRMEFVVCVVSVKLPISAVKSICPHPVGIARSPLPIHSSVLTRSSSAGIGVTSAPPLAFGDVLPICPVKFIDSATEQPLH